MFRRAVVGLLDNSLQSFPDLIQPLPWALLNFSVSLPTPPLSWASLLTLSSYWVSLPTPSLYVGLRRQFRATWPSRPQLKELKTAFTLARWYLIKSVHLLAACPSLLHLLHLKGGPLAVEGDLSLAERIALSSSSDNSIVWDRRIDSPLLRTIVWMRSLDRPSLDGWLSLSLLKSPQVYKPA